MAEMIKSTAADDFEFGAYHADAQGKRKGGVVVIQEIFGIDQYVRADVERWARAGFEAIAPAWSPFLIISPARTAPTAAHPGLPSRAPAAASPGYAFWPASTAATKTPTALA